MKRKLKDFWYRVITRCPRIPGSAVGGLLPESIPSISTEGYERDSVTAVIALDAVTHTVSNIEGALCMCASSIEDWAIMDAAGWSGEWAGSVFTDESVCVALCGARLLKSLKTAKALAQKMGARGAAVLYDDRRWYVRA